MRSMVVLFAVILVLLVAYYVTIFAGLLYIFG